MTFSLILAKTFIFAKTLQLNLLIHSHLPFLIDIINPINASLDILSDLTFSIKTNFICPSLSVGIQFYAPTSLLHDALRISRPAPGREMAYWVDEWVLSSNRPLESFWDNDELHNPLNAVGLTLWWSKHQLPDCPLWDNIGEVSRSCMRLETYNKIPSGKKGLDESVV